MSCSRALNIKLTQTFSRDSDWDKSESLSDCHLRLEGTRRPGGRSEPACGSAAAAGVSNCSDGPEHHAQTYGPPLQVRSYRGIRLPSMLIFTAPCGRHIFFCSAKRRLCFSSRLMPFLQPLCRGPITAQLRELVFFWLPADKQLYTSVWLKLGFLCLWRHLDKLLF